ncbi:MAG TPA: T9SS type A sorting domain-containing protein, partial [Bacteroidales bacterium]|nr:T9SS type A sorting domain-containing protein [Bacteroidales bacterium]
RYDTLYVDVQANGETYLKVTAEDRVTSISYRLIPDVQSNEAYITSFVYGVDQDASLIQYIPRGTTVDMLYRNVIPSDGASMQVYDKASMERMNGGLYKDDRLVVTAQDGETTRTYFFSILEDAGYLAYVVSDIYAVDQDTKMISGGVYETTPVNEFMGNLVPAPGASIKLEDKDGTVYTNGNLIKESRLKVTSANNQNVIYYTIEVLTSREDLNNSNITLYPNPTTGRVTVAGLEPGNRVHVYSMAGTLLRDVKVQQANAEISLEGQASGMYFVVVSNDKEVVGRYKLILK